MTEDLTKVMTATDIPKKERCAQSQSGFDPDEQRERDNDKTSLVTLNEQLKNLEASLEKSREEICDAFIAVSGEVNQIRPYFRKSGKVVTWNLLEDMALVEPDNSPEF